MSQWTRKKESSLYIIYKEGNIEKNPEEAKKIAFAIVKHRKENGKEEKGSKEEWKEDWKAVSESFKKGREQYRQMKEGKAIQFKRSVYGKLDFEIDDLEETLELIKRMWGYDGYKVFR